MAGRPNLRVIDGDGGSVERLNGRELRNLGRLDASFDEKVQALKTAYAHSAGAKQRIETALQFCRTHKAVIGDDDDVFSRLLGIDFTRDVQVVGLKRGVQLVSVQVPGRPNGQFFSFADDALSAGEVGIAGIGNVTLKEEDGSITNTGKVVTKVANLFGVHDIPDGQVLMSYASAIVDDWSVQKAQFRDGEKGMQAITPGGGRQLFIPNIRRLNRPVIPQHTLGTGPPS